MARGVMTQTYGCSVKMMYSGSLQIKSISCCSYKLTLGKDSAQILLYRILLSPSSKTFKTKKNAGVLEGNLCWLLVILGGSGKDGLFDLHHNYAPFFVVLLSSPPQVSCWILHSGNVKYSGRQPELNVTYWGNTDFNLFSRQIFTLD